MNTTDPDPRDGTPAQIEAAAVTMLLKLGIPAEEVAQLAADARRRRELSAR